MKVLISYKGLEKQAYMLTETKIQLQNMLDEDKRVADNEGKERMHSLIGKFKNLEHELDELESKLRNSQAKEDISRQYQKAQQEYDI